MNTARDTFRSELRKLAECWDIKCPPRWTMLKTLEELAEKRIKLSIKTVLDRESLILTATIDDGWGLGLELIHKACDVLGLPYRFLGLLLTPEEIIDACGEVQPNFLGLTILHDSSKNTLHRIVSEVPEDTIVFIGGSNFFEEAFFPRRVIFVPNVAYFIRFFVP